MSEGGGQDETTTATGAAVGRREFDALAGVVDGGVVLADGDGAVLEATDAFATESGRSPAAVVGEPLSTVFAAPSAKRVDEARSRLLDRLAADATEADRSVARTAELTVHVETPTGEQRTRELHLRAVATDGKSRGVVGVLRDGCEEQAVLAEREDVLQAMYDVSSDDSLSFEERIGEMLAVVRETVGTSYATLSRVDGSDYHFDVVDTDQDGAADLEAGETLPLDQTNCERVVETAQTVVVRDLDEQAPELASRDANRELGVSCYLGAPVVVDDEVQGTFCFYGAESREDGFEAWAVALVGLVAQWVEYELTQRQTTERLERSTAELREAEQRYRTLVEHVPNGAVALVNHDMEYTTVGGSPVDTETESSEWLEGKTVRDAVTDEFADVLEPKYRAALNGDSSTFEQDLGGRVARIHVFPVRGDDGEVVAAMGMSQDVTEQKERERELETYETIVGTVNDGIYVVDDQGRYETVNDAFCDITGYSRRELLGEHARFVVDEATLERAAEIRATAGKDERASIETTIETATGEAVPVEVTLSTLETDEDRKRVGVVRDVTERRERRRKLAESERKYRTLVEHFPDGAVGLFDETLEYTAVGGEMLDDLDVSPAERVGRSVHDVYSDEIASEVEPYFLAALDGEDQSFDIEYRGRHVSAQTLPVPNAAGEVDAGMLVVQDVTEQREYERQLEAQRQRLAALNQLNSVVQGVTEAVIDQSRRAEVERVACERLAESHSYEFAWIAEPDSHDEEVAVRAEAGTGSYLDEVSLSLDPDEPAGNGPTARALRTGELQTVRDVQTDPRYEPWRDTATAYGFQSSAAIPVRFEDTTFGVLNVYADRVEAFREEERVVVEHLGRLLGHAIAAAERKQALLSDTVVELEVHGENMARDLDLDDSPSSPVVLERAIQVDDTDFLVYGTSPAEELDALEAMVESVSAWQSLTTIGTTGDSTRFELRVSNPPLMSVVASVGGSVGRVRIDGADFQMTVHLPQDVDVRTVVERMREQYTNTEIVARRQVERDSGQLERFVDVWATELTDRQRTVVETAFFAGFFEWPRATSGEDVADRLDISGPTFSQHLRAAQQKLFARLVGADAENTKFTD